MKQASVIAAIGLGLILGATAKAGIIAQESWDAGVVNNWSMLGDGGLGGTLPGPNGTLGYGPGNTATPGNVGGLEDVAGPFVAPDADKIFTTTGSVIGTGDWVADNSTFVQFDFYVTAPGFSSLNFYFVNGGVTWTYMVTGVASQALGTWDTYQIQLSESAGWSNSGGGTWLTDLANIEQIGFQLAYNTGSSETYGFDNLTRGFTAPEPETYAAIGFALVSLAIAFRKRLADMLAMIRLPSAI